MGVSRAQPHIGVMANNHTQSASYSIKPEPLFRAVPLYRYRFGAGTDLLVSPLQSRNVLLTVDDANLLLSCSQFRSLSEHAYCAAGGGPHTDSIKERLVEFVAQGLLASSNLMDQMAATSPLCESNRRLSYIAIPTLDRPNELENALASYAANARRFDRAVRFFIADGSLSQSGRETCLRVIQSFCTKSQSEVFYAGCDEKRRFAKALVRSAGLPPAVLNFALFGDPSLGAPFSAGRNAILLHTLGELLLSTDDDTACVPSRASVPCDPGSALLVNEQFIEGDWWFFQTRDETQRFVKGLDIDVLGEHERLLGRTIVEVLKEARAGGIRIESPQCGQHLTSSLKSGRGRIRLTLNGSTGDSGLPSGTFFSVCSTESIRSKVVSSEAVYRLATGSREVVHQYSTMAVGCGGPFVSMFFGLDNTELLPPFLPSGRGADGLFGTLLNQCVDYSYYGLLPFNLPHHARGCRQYAAVHSPGSDAVGMLSAFAATHARNVFPTSTIDHLTGLGKYLIQLGSLPQSEFDEFTRLTFAGILAGRVSYLESLLRRFNGAPQFWAHEISEGIQKIQRSVTTPSFGIPEEWLAHSSIPDSRANLRRLVKQFGEVLYWWPAIVGGATAAIDQGIRIGRRVVN